MKNVSYVFVIAQIIGIVAWLFLFFSYYRKNTKKILFSQIICSILFIIHYFLLGAFSGVLTCFFDLIFDSAYYLIKKRKIVYIISIPIRILCGLFVFAAPIDFLPIAASLLEGYSLTKEKIYVVIGGIIVYSIWAVYDMFIMSIPGAISDMIIVVSNIAILVTILKKKKSATQ